MTVELILTVQSDKLVRVQTSAGGQGTLVPAKFDKLTLRTIELFQKWLPVKNMITDRRELQVVGLHLYNVLFQGEIETYFRLQLETAKKAGERLRLQLTFDDEVSDLASLPWEYLYFPGTQVREGFFFSINVDLVLSRYMPLEDGRESLAPEESPLRVLIAVSKPTDDKLGRVVADPVIEVIQKLTERYPIKVEVLDKPTIYNFCKALDFKPHVLHFIGHGRYHNEKGEIAMLDPDEKSVCWVGDQQFADFFTDEKTIPRLVFLHLCEGGKVDFDANFAGVAPKLIRAKVQAVVAMQYPITNQAAIAFSRQFYRQLAEGKPVDDAVQEGRRMITRDDPKTYDSHIFGTPVLYMHSFDGIIQPVVESQQQASSRSGKTDAAATPVGVQEMTAMADISKVISQIRAAAYEETGRKNLNMFAVVSEIDGTDWGKDEAEIRQKIEHRIAENNSSPMVSVYEAMLRTLKK